MNIEITLDIDKLAKDTENQVETIVNKLREETEKQILREMVTTSCAKPFTMQDITNAIKKIEEYKLKKIIVTSDIAAYNKLMSTLEFNTENLKYSPYVDGTYLIDMERLEKITKPKYVHFDPIA